MAAAQTPFLISEAVHGGWQRTKDRFGYLAVMLIAAMIISELPSIISSSMPDESLLAVLLSLVGVVLSIMVSRGIIMVSVEEARNKKSSWKSFLGNWKEILWFFLASLAYGLVVVAGIILLIIPGIYWSIKYQYVLFLVADKKMGIREAFSTSAKMTDGVKWDLIGFSFVTGIINFLGFFALLIGLLMTVPATAIARAKVYNQLLKRV